VNVYMIKVTGDTPKNTTNTKNKHRLITHRNDLYCVEWDVKP